MSLIRSGMLLGVRLIMKMIVCTVITVEKELRAHMVRMKNRASYANFKYLQVDLCIWKVG